MRKYIPSVVFALLSCAPLAAAENALPERWVYVATNLQVDKVTDKLLELMGRAAQAGYTGIQLNDSKFAKLDDLGGMETYYFKNVERVKSRASELKLELIPGLFSIGYSNDILWHDPNLAEALPVVDAPFVVQGGVARLVPDAREFKKISFKDDNVSVENGVWKVVDPNGKNCRIVFKFPVQPHREYHISALLKTENFQGAPEIKILGGPIQLAWSYLGAKATQDWTEVHQVFNSQECTEVNIYFGCWDAKHGTLQWKDAKFEQVGLMNAVRRDGAPLKITNEKGEALTEGKDFEKFADPLMGSKPYKGTFDVYHQPPVLKTSLPDGTKLKVSYYHTMTVYDGQVMICPSEPKTWALFKHQAELVHKAFGAKKYFMHFDEIRVLNHCAACSKRNLQPGQILADAARQATGLLHDTAPGAAIYTWNDMFDPFHNAVEKNYYLVKGDLRGSWEGLDKAVTIVEWNYGKRDESMDFFAKRGHKIIAAGYYDGSMDTAKWIESLKQSPASSGIMYTTWQQKYGELENFLKQVNAAFPTVK